MESNSTSSSSVDVTRASLLVRLNQQGPAREVAWTEFHDLYAPVIAGFARRVGTRPQDVDDLVQEVLKAFFRASPEFVYDPAKGRFRGYLKTCVWRKMAELRRGQRRSSPDRGGGPPRINPAALSEVEVDATWNDVWETEKLGRALAVVRQRYSINADRQRTFRAFELCALLDRPGEQVAAELGLSVEGVRTAKSRVSRAVREAFEGLDGIEG